MEVFSLYLKIAKAAQSELGRGFHLERTVNVKVLESGFMPLWDGLIKCR